MVQAAVQVLSVFPPNVLLQPRVHLRRYHNDSEPGKPNCALTCVRTLAVYQGGVGGLSPPLGRRIRDVAAARSSAHLGQLVLGERAKQRQ